MKTRSELLAFLNSNLGLALLEQDYKGHLSKKLTLASCISLKKESHGYHIEVTNPGEEMSVFPVVTSSRYEADPAGSKAEKRRYFLKAECKLHRTNLLQLVDRAITKYDEDTFKVPQEQYSADKTALLSSSEETIASSFHSTFQIRSTGQRQLEIGLSTSDGSDFIALRRCLFPGDYLVFLQRSPSQYDVIGVAAELVNQEDIAGWSIEAGATAPLSSVHIDDPSSASSGLGAETERMIAQVIRAAERYGDNSIIALAGVPGTGKSYLAEIAAQRIAGDPSRVFSLQLHPSFTYEEFVEGLRLVDAGKVKRRRGALLKASKLASDSAKPVVLLLEELTRANLPAVLGELLTFVEHRDREFTTLYGRRVKISKDLVILATYNPLDRSAIDMDAAFLRRLRIVECPPSVGQLREMLENAEVPEIVIQQLEKLFAECAKHPDFATWMPFGHGVFAGVRAEIPDMFDLWQERIKHLLSRPGLPEHRFAPYIKQHYPWQSAEYVLEPAEPDNEQEPLQGAQS